MYKRQIIGGSKISTKIDIIKNLLPKFDNIIIVGAMANNFIEYFGHNIGKSIKEKNCNKIIEEIISLSKKEECEISYPEDVLVSKDLNGSFKKRKLNEVLNDEMILDIGPKTIDKITNIIILVRPYYGMDLLDILKTLTLRRAALKLQKQ